MLIDLYTDLYDSLEIYDPAEIISLFSLKVS